MMIGIYERARLIAVVAEPAPHRAWKAAASAVKTHAMRAGSWGGKGWFREGERVGFERGVFRAVMLAETTRRAAPERAAAVDQLSRDLAASIFVYTK